MYCTLKGKIIACKSKRHLLQCSAETAGSKVVFISTLGNKCIKAFETAVCMLTWLPVAGYPTLQVSFMIKLDTWLGVTSPHQE